MRVLSAFVLAALGSSGCTITCGEGTHEVDGMCVLDVTDPESIREMCRDEAPGTEVYDVVFPKLEPGCPWNEGDNIDERNGYLTARMEQEVDIDLPEGVVVCDLDFDFTLGGGVFQEMIYDDHIFLTFDDVVLTSSDKEMVAVMPTEDELPVYDWSSIVGSAGNFWNAEAFCLGADTGTSYCEIPPTESSGRIAMQFDRETVSELAWRVLGRTSMSMKFITIGDDDPDQDCRHEEFAFQVFVPWIPVE